MDMVLTSRCFSGSNRMAVLLTIGMFCLAIAGDGREAGPKVVRAKTDQELLDWIEEHPDATEIALRENRRISPEALQRLVDLNGLEALDVGLTNLNDETMEFIGRLSNLKYLVISATYVTNKGFSHISDRKSVV